MGGELSEQLSGFGIFTLCWAALVTLFVCIKSVFNARSWRFPFALSLSLSQLLSLSLPLSAGRERAAAATGGARASAALRHASR